MPLEKKNDEGDHSLPKDEMCWILCGNVSVWIRHLDDGRVSIETYPKNNEANIGPIETLIALQEDHSHE